ncbi:MAG: ACP S-malonyltransferase [Clostridia bacterium]|nr:ACP S-malonyltransferase [Clostridia bacterium]
MKAVFMFAGQGAQYPGMGRDLYEGSEAAKRVFDAAGDELKRLCFEGSEEELMATENTQPCVYTVTMAAYEAFRKAMPELEPMAVAGFSLGEYSALTAAGYITDIADGADIMRHRGLWMGEAGKDAEGNPLGSMAAAIGDAEKVHEAVEKARGDGMLIEANFNAPTQTVVSGDIEAVGRFVEIAKELKLRVTPLKVASAFHSPLMEPAAEKMRALFMDKGYAAKAAEAAASAGVPVYSNLTAEPVDRYRREGAEADDLFAPEDFADVMARQLMSSVQWVKTVQDLIAQDADTFIEFGPGKTLSGLVKKIDRSVRTLRVENMETLAETLEALKA